VQAIIGHRKNTLAAKKAAEFQAELKLADNALRSNAQEVIDSFDHKIAKAQLELISSLDQRATAYRKEYGDEAADNLARLGRRFVFVSSAPDNGKFDETLDAISESQLITESLLSHIPQKKRQELVELATRINDSAYTSIGLELQRRLIHAAEGQLSEETRVKLVRQSLSIVSRLSYAMKQADAETTRSRIAVAISRTAQGIALTNAKTPIPDLNESIWNLVQSIPILLEAELESDTNQQGDVESEITGWHFASIAIYNSTHEETWNELAVRFESLGLKSASNRRSVDE
jgi:hypothetical protein